jgi:glycosyltransferase involved in cell wall biosynthesis
MKICILLPYANPHTTGWIDEFIQITNHEVVVGIVNSVRKYRRNHFEEADHKNYLYFFKDTNRKFFYSELAKSECLITLGIFEPWFLKAIFQMGKVNQIYVLSEPLRPQNIRKALRRCYVSMLTLIKRRSRYAFLCMGGPIVKEQYFSFGFRKSSYYQFGHFPILSLTEKINFKIKTIKFIFVGKLIERKGVDILIQLIQYLQKKYLGWEFLIVGQGELKEELLKNVPGEKRIQYIENISHAAIMKAKFDESHILFLPSYFDGWGAVVNEALSSCCSLLLSENVYAGVPLLMNGENGFSFNPYNLNELYKAVDKYFNNPGILNNHFLKSQEIFLEWNHQNAAHSFSNLINGKSNPQNKTLLNQI